MIFNNNLTAFDIKNINLKSQQEHQIQIQETKEKGWILDEINSMKISLCETGDINGSNYVKIPLRSNAILTIDNNDKFCFIWSILAHSHPCEDNYPSRLSNYKPYFNAIKFQGFDLTNGFKCSDMHKFEQLNNLSINIFELNFYEDQKNGNII